MTSRFEAGFLGVQPEINPPVSAPAPAIEAALRKSRRLLFISNMYSGKVKKITPKIQHY
jgi:hypothetical protein